MVGGILHCAGLPDPCLPHEDSQSSGDQATKAMRDFFVLAFEHFGDREVLKKEFQEFVQQDEGVHELFDWIDFAARRGLTSFGKLIAKFDKRELGGITFRLKQTSKNCATYRFFREGEGESANLPLNARTCHQPLRDVGTLRDIFTTPYIEKKNDDEKNKKQNELNGLYIGDRENSLNVPTSLQPGFLLPPHRPRPHRPRSDRARPASPWTSKPTASAKATDSTRGRATSACSPSAVTVAPSGPSTSAPSDTISGRSSRSWRKRASSPTTPSSTCSGCG